MSEINWKEILDFLQSASSIDYFSYDEGKKINFERLKERNINENKNSINNILIEGDNTNILKSMIGDYESKIDVIYIDPPYNTCLTQFEYNDSFEKNEWLKTMCTRLILSKSLLNDKGTIYLSIDDNMFCELKILCDLVFGEKNKKAIFKIITRDPEVTLSNKAFVRNTSEYLMIYCKNAGHVKLKRKIGNANIKDYRYKISLESDYKPDELMLDGKRVEIYKNGYYKIDKCLDINDNNILKRINIKKKNERKNGTSEFYKKYLEKRREIDGENILYKVYNIGKDGLGYRYFLNNKKEQNATYFQGVPKIYREKAKEVNIPLEKVKIEEPYDDVIVMIYENERAGSELNKLLGKKYHICPKPIELLEFILKMHDDDITILDYFAGSGTTGHAVMKMNVEDNGKRRFILCQNSEGKESINICRQITYERLRKVINQYANSNYFFSLTYGCVE